MMTNLTLRVLVLPGLCLALVSPPLQAQLTKIADGNTAIPNGTGNFGDTHFGAPVVYGSTVVFYGTDSGQTQKGVYIWSNGTLTRAADLTTAVPGGSGNFTAFSFYDYSVNSSGDALFRAQGATSSGFYRSSGGTLTRVVDTSFAVPGGTGNFSGVFTLTESGGVSVFVGRDSANVFGIYSYDGATVTALVNPSTTLPGTSAHLGSTDYVIDDNGTLAFWAALSDGSSAVYSYSGGTLHLIAQSGSTTVPGSAVKFTSFLSPPNIKGNTVTFVGSFSVGSMGIYSANVDGSGLTRQVDTTINTPDNSGHFTTFYGGHAYGNGTLYFAANNSGGSGSGIYAVTSGTITNVIVPGDMLDSKTIKSAEFDGTSALRGGNVALTVTFTDNSRALYLAPMDTGGSSGSAPSLSAPAWTANGFQMTLTLTAGQSYRLQGSTDLSSPANWTTLTTINAAPASYQFLDTEALNMPFRCYRIVSP